MRIQEILYKVDYSAICCVVSDVNTQSGTRFFTAYKSCVKPNLGEKITKNTAAKF